MATYEQARSAKIEALALLAGRVDLNGIGIRGRDDAYELTVNLRTASLTENLPREISGVPLHYEFVGEIEPLGMTPSKKDQQETASAESGFDKIIAWATIVFAVGSLAAMVFGP